MTRISTAPALAALAIVVPALPLGAADSAQQEQNKKTVLEFYDKGLNQKDFEAAAKYFGPRYTQHNPNAADGPEGFNLQARERQDRRALGRRSANSRENRQHQRHVLIPPEASAER